MRELFSMVERAQQTRATVLLNGETGTGKERIARAIHSGSQRARRPFVAVNCAAFAENLLESELFGYRRGAFTGAERDKAGLLEVAHRGSLLLDEVGEMSRGLQAKLLRFLQEREVLAVGSLEAKKVDVRIIAATHRDLREDVRAGRFREDLYYRLAVFELTVPPLRERMEDLPLLAEHFRKAYGQSEGKRLGDFTESSRHLLLAHRWPGNVRELENEIYRAVALCREDEAIGPAAFSARVGSTALPVTRQPDWENEPLKETIRRVESWVIRQALDRHGGHRTRTARSLGLTREGLYKKLKRLEIDPKQWNEPAGLPSP